MKNGYFLEVLNRAGKYFSVKVFLFEILFKHARLKTDQNVFSSKNAIRKNIEKKLSAESKLQEALLLYL